MEDGNPGHACKILQILGILALIREFIWLARESFDTHFSLAKSTIPSKMDFSLTDVSIIGPKVILEVIG